MAEILKKFSRFGVGFKVRFFGLILACVLHIVGFSTDYWSSFKIDGDDYDGAFIGHRYDDDVSSNIGLWRLCGCRAGLCACGDYFNADTLDWLIYVRAWETQGLIHIVFAICSVVWIVCRRRQRKAVQLIPTLFTFGAGYFILAGVASYAHNLPSGLQYSFALCCCSGSMCIILALYMSYECCTTCVRPDDDTTDIPTTIDGQNSPGLRAMGMIEQPGYDQPDNDPPRYERIRIDRLRRQPREYNQGQPTHFTPDGHPRIDRPRRHPRRYPRRHPRGMGEPNQLHRTQYTPGGFLAGLPSGGNNGTPAYTPGDAYPSQQTTLIANTQNVSEGSITTQPRHLTESLQRTAPEPEQPSRLADRPPCMADTPSAVDTTGQFDGNTDTRDC